MYRAKKITSKLGDNMNKKCNYIQSDFTKMTMFEDGAFDRVYSIEATCHVMDRTKPFGEAFRVLKEGGMFASYEWLMTKNYDGNNPEHVRIKRGIEHGDGLPEMIGIPETLQALKDVGFELVEAFDVAEWAEKVYGPKNVPWYQPLQAGWSLDGWEAHCNWPQVHRGHDMDDGDSAHCAREHLLHGPYARGRRDTPCQGWGAKSVHSDVPYRGPQARCGRQRVQLEPREQASHLAPYSVLSHVRTECCNVCSGYRGMKVEF